MICELCTREELQKALPVMQELRPHLTEAKFFELYEAMQQEGYHLFALCNEQGEPISLAGVIILTNFYNERHVFIYDLVTAAEHRSKGYGKQILSYVEAWGKENGCKMADLTSGFVRIAAHSFYEREGYNKVSFAFRKKL
ncbi:MAG: GNAT family N-acetyltransferase [Ectobacillus sp.]